jgi:hypothetical protein
MKELGWHVVWLVGAIGLACSKPAPVGPTPEIVYGELVNAGCLAPDDGGVTAVAQERALPDAPPWILCLFDGGTVAACQVPCDAASK